jgi:hypothetical protein
LANVVLRTMLADAEAGLDGVGLTTPLGA